jgi:hypothetical protein
MKIVHPLASSIENIDQCGIIFVLIINFYNTQRIKNSINIIENFMNY